MKQTNQINKIPLHYARLTNHRYGSRGVHRTFSIDKKFYGLLEVAFKEVFDRCPYGQPEVITTAGIFVNKPGQHGHGTAFDLDAIFWDHHTLVTGNYPHQRVLYLGIESILRKHFGLVLNYRYPHHEDHWHIDTSVSVDFNESSKSETLYLQMVLKNIYLQNIIVDGIWGRQTSGIVKNVLGRLKIKTPITTKKNYLAFLDITATIAFRLIENKNSPLDLLHNLSDVVAELPVHSRTTIREALNSFMDHNITASWLHNMDGQASHNVTDIIDELIA